MKKNGEIHGHDAAVLRLTKDLPNKEQKPQEVRRVTCPELEKLDPSSDGSGEE